MRVTGLKTEQLDDPLGLELARPRLSWRLESNRAGALQSAYRVRVAASGAAIAEGRADLWDSGKVPSDRCFDVTYAGAPLAARQRAWWTVEVWDDEGEPAAPPEPGFWEMGLTGPEDWVAEWLIVETEEERADREAGLIWVWGDEEAEADPRRFRLKFGLSKNIPAASLIVGARGRLANLYLDGRALPLPDPSPHAFGPPGVVEVDLGDLAQGEHALAASVAATPNPRDPRPWRGAFAAILKLRQDDGRVRRMTTGQNWRTNAKSDVDWTEVTYRDVAWPPAEPAERPPRQSWPAGGAMLLRRSFAVAKKVATARLYATALGAYEAFLNGRKVGDALLAPESTDFRRRLLYRAYDVTDLVCAGDNVLAAHVGDGWYASVVAPGGRYAFGPPPRRFLAQLEVTFADGSRQLVTTGGGWKAAASPVLVSEIYNGETWDARREIDGWNKEAWLRRQRLDCGPHRRAAGRPPRRPPRAADPHRRNAGSRARCPSRPRAPSCSTSARTSPAPCG